MSSTTVSAAKVVGLCAAGGAVLNVVCFAARNDNAFGSAAINGAIGGTALGALGGLVVAIFSSTNRDEGLEVAGLGLGATIIGGLLT